MEEYFICIKHYEDYEGKLEINHIYSYYYLIDNNYCIKSLIEMNLIITLTLKEFREYQIDKILKND